MPHHDDSQVRKYRPHLPKAPIKLADLQGQMPQANATPVVEIGGRKDGLEPTRYGDWEKNGRCCDF